MVYHIDLKSSINTSLCEFLGYCYSLCCDFCYRVWLPFKFKLSYYIFCQNNTNNFSYLGSSM